MRLNEAAAATGTQSERNGVGRAGWPALENTLPMRPPVHSGQGHAQKQARGGHSGAAARYRAEDRARTGHCRALKVGRYEGSATTSRGTAYDLMEEFSRRDYSLFPAIGSFRFGLTIESPPLNC